MGHEEDVLKQLADILEGAEKAEEGYITVTSLITQEFNMTGPQAAEAIKLYVQHMALFARNLDLTDAELVAKMPVTQRHMILGFASGVVVTRDAIRGREQ